eukprot:tig00021589_g22721.t1
MLPSLDRLKALNEARILASAQHACLVTYKSSFVDRDDLCIVIEFCEIFRGQLYSAKADIWSLGVLLYWMSSLRAPFDASSLPELARRVVTGVRPALPATVGGELRGVIEAALRPDPAARPSAAALLSMPCVQARRHSMSPAFAPLGIPPPSETLGAFVLASPVPPAPSRLLPTVRSSPRQTFCSLPHAQHPFMANAERKLNQANRRSRS